MFSDSFSVDEEDGKFCNISDRLIVTVWETVVPPNFICVCPTFTAYILFTMGQILRKLGGNVQT